MDFLKIRKKARERASARGSVVTPATSTSTRTSTPTRTPTPTPAPTTLAAAPAPEHAADADRRASEELEGALAARLEGTAPLDEGFTRWRPGASPAPRVVDFAPSPQPLAEPRSEDFAIVTRASATVPFAVVPPPDVVPSPVAPERQLRRAPLDEFFYRPDEETPELPEIGATVEPEPEDDVGSAAREEYLTFLLGPEEYAIAIERVREVVKAPPITEVPRAPAHVLGVVTVRGEVVAVLDPRRRLGLPGAPPVDGAGRIVIVDGGDGACALLVDAVASVVRLPAGALEPCPQGIGGPRAELLAGIGREGDRLFTVLDLGALLRRAAAPQRDAEGPRAGR